MAYVSPLYPPRAIGASRLERTRVGDRSEAAVPEALLAQHDRGALSSTPTRSFSATLFRKGLGCRFRAFQNSATIYKQRWNIPRRPFHQAAPERNDMDTSLEPGLTQEPDGRDPHDHREQ